MDNSVNMNPGANNVGGINFSQVLGICKVALRVGAATKLNQLKASADFGEQEEFGATFLSCFVVPLAKEFGVLDDPKILKLENLEIDSREIKNVLLAVSGVVYDLIHDEECYRALLENLDEGNRAFFESAEIRQHLLKLRLEDIESVVDKLAKRNFFSRVESIFNKIMGKEFKASDLKSEFWDVENTRGKVNKGLAIAEAVVTCFVAVTSCFLYVGFLFLDNYIDKRVDAAAKLEYGKLRSQLYEAKSLLASGRYNDNGKDKLVAEIEELDKHCSSLSGNLTDKLARLDLKKVNKYDFKKSILSVVFCLLCPPYLIKKGISLVRNVLDATEERSSYKSAKEKIEGQLRSKNVPLLPGGNNGEPSI